MVENEVEADAGRHQLVWASEPTWPLDRRQIIASALPPCTQAYILLTLSQSSLLVNNHICYSIHHQHEQAESPHPRRPSHRDLQVRIHSRMPFPPPQPSNNAHTMTPGRSRIPEYCVLVRCSRIAARKRRRVPNTPSGRGTSHTRICSPESHKVFIVSPGSGEVHAACTENDADDV